MLEDDLALKYKYKKLPDDISKEARDFYSDNIPKFLNKEGDDDFKLYSKNDTLFSNGYTRIVIGDYGSFIEFNKNQVVRENIMITKGQEYRVHDERYKNNVKYAWLTTKDNSGIKIYYQYRTVEYADYIPEYFYVSHYEILL